MNPLERPGPESSGYTLEAHRSPFLLPSLCFPQGPLLSCLVLCTWIHRILQEVAFVSDCFHPALRLLPWAQLLSQCGVLQSSRAPPLASSILSFQVAVPTNSTGQAQAKSLEPEAKEKSVILRLSLLEILIFCSLWIFALFF